MTPDAAQVLTEVLNRLHAITPDERDWVLAQIAVAFPDQLSALAPLSSKFAPRRRRGHPPPCAPEQQICAPEAQSSEARDSSVSRGGRGGVSAFLSSFEQFWSLYPKKRNKRDAERSWLKLKPDEQLTQKILAALKAQMTWPEWQRDDGRYIPYPATWLNGCRWNDEPDPVRPRGATSNGGGADDMDDYPQGLGFWRSPADMRK